MDDACSGWRQFWDTRFAIGDNGTWSLRHQWLWNISTGSTLYNCYTMVDSFNNRVENYQQIELDLNLSDYIHRTAAPFGSRTTEPGLQTGFPGKLSVQCICPAGVWNTQFLTHLVHILIWLTPLWMEDGRWMCASSETIIGLRFVIAFVMEWLMILLRQTSSKSVNRSSAERSNFGYHYYHSHDQLVRQFTTNSK